MCWKRVCEEDKTDEDKNSLRRCFLRVTGQRISLVISESLSLLGTILQNTLLQQTSKQDLPGLSEALLGSRFVFLAVSEAPGLFPKAHPDGEDPPTCRLLLSCEKASVRDGRWVCQEAHREYGYSCVPLNIA